MTTTLRLILHQLRFEQRIFWRTHSNVFITFALPLILLLSVSFAHGGAGHRREIVTGIIAVVVVGTAMQALAISLVFHREQGVLKRLGATPASHAVLLAARIASTTVVCMLVMVAIVIVAVVAMGVAPPHNPIVGALVTVFGVIAFSGMGLGLATIVPSADAAPAVTTTFYLVFMFVSGVFYPVSALPHPIRVAADILPMDNLVEPMRALWIEGHDAHGMALRLVVLAVWGLVGTLVALRWFRWQPAHEG